MEAKFNAEAVQIDLNTWERNPLYELFGTFTEPFHGVCLRVDCTEAFRFAKDSHISVFLTLLHRSLIAAHQVENFRTRIVDGAVWRFNTIHGGSAVGRPNGTIGFGHYPYKPKLIPFVQEASLELERVRSRNDLERYPGQDLIRYSVLPWFDFTSISHARNLDTPDSAPKITFGKINEAGGRSQCPYQFTSITRSQMAYTSRNLSSSSNTTWRRQRHFDRPRCSHERIPHSVRTHRMFYANRLRLA